MLCKHCGKEISDTSIFCNYCGQKVEQPETIKEEETILTPNPSEEAEQEKASERTEGKSEQTASEEPTPNPSEEAEQEPIPEQIEEKSEQSAPKEKSKEKLGAKVKSMSNVFVVAVTDLLSVTKSQNFFIASSVLLLILTGLGYLLGKLAGFFEGFFMLLQLILTVYWVCCALAFRKEPTGDDSKDWGYYLWEKKALAENVEPVEFKGYLDPARISRTSYPVEPKCGHFAQTSLNQYYFKPEVSVAKQLGKLVVGRDYFWVILETSAMLLLLFPGYITMLSLIITWAGYQSMYYYWLYYPGIVSMAKTPHFLPVGMSPDTARERVCSELKTMGVPLTEENGQILVENQYPLTITDKAFHVDMPEKDIENHRSQHLKRLSELNIMAAKALFPDRMTNPILPVTEDKTHYTAGEKIRHITLVVFCIIIVAFLGMLTGAWSTPAKMIQSSIWEDYSATQTLGDAFEENFKRTQWEDISYGDEKYIEFSGYIPATAATVDVKVTILFLYDEELEQFSVDSATIDDELVPGYVAGALMKFGYDGNLEELLGAIVGTELVSSMINGAW